MSLNTSLRWSDFLRFWVLEETTPWEHWDNLYSKEHYGRKPLMCDSYLTHGWNKQSKTPVWLPQEVKNFGTLRKILEKWFPSLKDKVTIIFEYINKDHLQISTTAPITRFTDLSIEPEVFNQVPKKYNSANHPSIAFVTGPPGPQNQRAHGPLPCPAPLNGLGRGFLFSVSMPLPPTPPIP